MSFTGGIDARGRRWHNLPMPELPASLDPDDPRASVRRRLLLMVAGGMATILMLACCICGGAMFYFRPRIEQSPEKAVALTKQVLRTITIPEQFEPRGTIELNVFHQLEVRGAYYELPKVESLLALIHVDSRWNSKARVRQHIRDTMLERGGAEEPLLVEKREVREIQIGNEPVKFEFAIAKDMSTDKTYRLVEGLVAGTTGDVLIMVKIDALYWDQFEELVTRMLESIQ